MHQCIKFILFWIDTLQVSDGLSVHHQEFKTVHTATGICQTDTAVCLLASRQQTASRFFSVSLRVLSQCNLRRRSLQGPRSPATGWLTNTTLSSGFFCFFICGSSLSDYKLIYYNTLSSVSTALWLNTRHLQ